MRPSAHARRIPPLVSVSIMVTVCAIPALQARARDTTDPGGSPTTVEMRPPPPVRTGDGDGGPRNAGIGINAGVVMLRLSADRALRTFGGESGTQLADDAPTSIASFDLRETLFEIAPTIQMGGDRFYFRMEAPLRQSATLRTYGVGFYPLNYGYYVPRWRIMPSASAGAVFSYLTDRRTDAVGPLVETRVSVGVKFFPVRGLALSMDVARTPWAIGALHGSGPEWWRRADARGGIGTGWALGLGVFWL